MTGTIVLAGVGAVLVSTAAAGWRRWWVGGRIVARQTLPRPSPPAPPALQRWLTDAAITADPAFVLRAWAAALAVGAILAALAPSGIVVVLVVLVGPPIVVVSSRGRAARLRTAQLPLALEAVAASMRAGLALGPSIAEAASVGPPLGPELAEVVRRAGSGQLLAVAVGDWADGAANRATDLAAAALAVAATVGGPGADAVEAAAASVREHASADAETAALSVQARLSAVVLSAAPVVFTTLLATVDPASARFLFTSPTGWACLTAGLVLDAIGAIWMRHLVRATS